MPIPANRTIIPEQTRNFGRFGDTVEVPPLTDIQTRSYARFLQLELPPEKREPIGLEAVLPEIFPIGSYDKSPTVESAKYHLDNPPYTPQPSPQPPQTY